MNTIINTVYIGLFSACTGFDQDPTGTWPWTLLGEGTPSQTKIPLELGPGPCWGKELPPRPRSHWNLALDPAGEGNSLPDQDPTGTWPWTLLGDGTPSQTKIPLELGSRPCWETELLPRPRSHWNYGSKHCWDTELLPRPRSH